MNVTLFGVRNIFDWKHYSKENRIWKINNCFLALLVLIHFIILSIYNKNQVYWILGAIFCTFLMLSMVISKGKSIWELITILLGIPVLITQYLEYDWNEPLVRILSPLIIVSFTAAYLYYADSLFRAAWDRNMFNFRTEWMAIKQDSLRRVLIFVAIGSGMAALFHFFNAFAILTINKKFSVDWFHQLVIGILLLFVYFSYLSTEKSINNSRKGKLEKFDRFIFETAKTVFHISIIYFFFDTLLEVYRIVQNGYVSVSNISWFIINFLILYIAFKAVSHDERSMLHNPKSPIVREKLKK
ncbi:MAG TPA: hypothetical protein DEP85_00645 [Holosporales bacterium]|nr:hypothetical protein [Candidatus Woesearchaeota archaeon]HCC24008.1 hypothetical protein [Holosporales bacterium]HIH22170.1 hypothetical protein [Candidatus Micrarchaeota archaeon]